MQDSSALELYLATFPSLASLYSTHDGLVQSIHDQNKKMQESASPEGRFLKLLETVTKSLSEYTIRKEDYSNLLKSYDAAKVFDIFSHI